MGRGFKSPGFGQDIKQTIVDLKQALVKGAASIRHDLTCGSWIVKKNLQIFARSHLSRSLALLLCFLVLGRELPGLIDIGRRLIELQGLSRSELSIIACIAIVIALWAYCIRLLWRGQMRGKTVGFLLASAAILDTCSVLVLHTYHKFLRFMALSPSPFEWLIIVVTVGTIIAAVWEVGFNKLSISFQEIRFARGIRELLYELEKLCYGKDGITDPEQRLAKFIEGFVEIAAETICGHEKIDACFMIKKPQGDSLWLIKKSKGAQYPDIEIPLTPDNTGAAGVAFRGDQIAYVPNKDLQEVWVFKAAEGSYEALKPTKAWVRTKEEPFHSVLCVPTAVYQSKDKRSRFGVFNLSTLSRDPFVDRDFLMAECFASVLAQAIAYSRQGVPSKGAEG